MTKRHLNQDSMKSSGGPLSVEKYVVITPARDEGEYLGRMINSMIGQTVRPAQWIIVDDGSADNTLELARVAAARHDWIRVVSLTDRGFRQVGAGAVQAFNAGLNALSINDYQFICCVDADIVLQPRYFELLLQKFSANPRLGNACGQIYEDHGGRLVKLRANPELTYGAIKCWRRECFTDIGGLVNHSSWDGIDCYQSMNRGWQTGKFEDRELQVLHLRAVGSSDRHVYKGWFRRGHSLYFLRAHPLWTLASLAFHVFDRPLAVGALCMAAGYTEAWLKRRPRYDQTDFVQFLQGWQMRKLKSLIRLKSPGPSDS
ncbi:MAG TPA: glycosyltransferase [Blastocatellia bacterium]|nr:glycosyltransferase [Blastocatellia bacterium]